MYSAINLAANLRHLGSYAEARDLARDTLDRSRRVLGRDHPSTLYAANILGANLRELGEVKAARDLDQDTLDRYRRVLGEDHPGTLYAVSCLANDLRVLGEVQVAGGLHLAQDAQVGGQATHGVQSAWMILAQHPAVAV